jgi:ABC-2 type transport system ATP-binding protein
MDDYVKVDKLTKKYGDVLAVDNLSFTVKKGEIFGFLGPNGAGKTSTLNVISTLANFDRGEVNIAGYDLVREEFKIKGLLGVVPQEIALYQNLNAVENVSLFASLYGLKGIALKNAVDEALDFVGLADERKKLSGKMSGGMQRRLNIACGIAHKPELIIMDEPTVGVDAKSRDTILGSIKTLRDKGATIIYTSHYMPEVQEIADRIAIINKGRLAAIGTENELLEMVTDRKSVVIGITGKVVSEIETAVADIRMLAGVKMVRYESETDEIRLEIDMTMPSISPILRIIMDKGFSIRVVSEDALSLETTFLALTGTDLRSDDTIL